MLALLFLVLAPFGCDGGTPADPCDRDLACAVAGVDIAILDVTPIWTDEQDYDASVDARVVRPGDEIAVEVLVMNRGTVESSHAATLVGVLRDLDRALTAETPIGPLDVGERARYTLTFHVPTGPRFVRWHEQPDDSVAQFRLEYDDYEDADTANDHRAGFDFHVAAPLLELTLSDLPDTMLTQTTYGATLVIDNRSETTPFAGGVTMELCAIYFGDDFCAEGTIESFSPVTLGAVPADGSRTQPVSLRLKKDALYWFDEVQHIAIAPCLPRAGQDAECILPAGFDPLTDYPVTAIPNLMIECEPPELVDGASFPLATGLCAHVVDDATYALASFDAVAGECWRAQFTTASSGSIVIKDAHALELVPFDGPDCVRIERSGPHFVIVYPATPGGTPNGTLLLERIP